MSHSLARKLSAVSVVGVIAVIVRATGAHSPAPVALLVFGAAILAASFLLAWAAEAAQVDISGGLAIAILALIAVLPEYAIDIYFAYTAGHRPEFASYAAANMTGSNRLLLGVGWPLVAFVALRALSRQRDGVPTSRQRDGVPTSRRRDGVPTSRRRDGVPTSRRDRRPVRELVLDPQRRIELAFLGVAGVLAFVMPASAQIHVALGALLLALFAAYLWRVSRGGVTEPELIGTPARIAELPRRRRRWTVASLFVVAAVLVVASAEPFANALIDTGSQFGIDRFLLVQWLAPIASEAPEFVVAFLLARRGNSDDALGTLLSSKVNQWTLLVGSLPFAYWLGGGGVALHLDARQVEEVLLTATQTALGLAVLVRLRFHRRAAVALLALFAVQLALPGTTARLVISAVYAVLAVAEFVRNRKALAAVVAGVAAVARHRPPQGWAGPARLARRAGVTIVGVALLGTGVVMLVAPGPGLVVIAVSLLVLGTEYEWARHRYESTRHRAEELAERAVARPWSFALSALFGAAMIALGVALIVVDELPGSGIASGVSVGLGGTVVLASLGYALVHSRRRRRADSGAGVS